MRRRNEGESKKGGGRGRSYIGEREGVYKREGGTLEVKSGYQSTVLHNAAVVPLCVSFPVSCLWKPGNETKRYYLTCNPNSLSNS